MFEGGRRIDEHVGARLDGALVERPGREVERVAAQAAAAIRHRVGRVIEIMVLGFGLRKSRTQRPVAAERVGLAAGVEVIPGILGAGQRPIVFFAPDVFPHHENLHRFLALDPVVNAFQDVVVPAEHDLVLIELGFRSKVNFSDFSASSRVAAQND